MSGQRLGSEAVVDASVVVKFLIQESDSDKADALFERFLDGKFRLLAPDFLFIEFLNVLWFKTRQKELDEK